MASTWNWIAKLAIIASAVLLLSLGLCGLAIKSNDGGSLAIIALIGMLVGGAGVVVAAIAAIVTAIAGSGTNRTPPPPPPTFPR